MTSKKLSAIILARSGSKGIKNKNLRKIGGKSLIEFSIQSAKKSKYVENIFLSSDSKEYLELSEKLGAKKILRPHSLADDFSSSEDALIHAIKEIEESNQQLSEYIIFIQCTSPFTTGKDIDNAFEYFVGSNFDSLFSGKVFHGFLWNQSTVEGINHNQKLVRQRRQDIDLNILENGAFYIFKTKSFKKEKNRFSGKIGYYLQDKINSYEIDDHEDLMINRFIYKKYIRYNQLINKNDVKLIVCDFDGVFTDNNVLTDKNGHETVFTSKTDSLSISIFKKDNPYTPIFVLTSELNESVKKRCQKLDLKCFQSKGDKRETLEKILESNDINPQQVVYLGNDKNDITCLEYVGYPVVVADYNISTFDSAKIILNSNGGNGAISELLTIIK